MNEEWCTCWWWGLGYPHFQQFWWHMNFCLYSFLHNEAPEGNADWIRSSIKTRLQIVTFAYLPWLWSNHIHTYCPHHLPHWQFAPWLQQYESSRKSDMAMKNMGSGQSWQGVRMEHWSAWSRRLWISESISGELQKEVFQLPLFRVLNCIPSDITSFFHCVTRIGSFLLRHKTMVQRKRCRLCRRLDEYIRTVWQEKGFVKTFCDISYISNHFEGDTIMKLSLVLLSWESKTKTSLFRSGKLNSTSISTWICNYENRCKLGE